MNVIGLLFRHPSTFLKCFQATPKLVVERGRPNPAERLFLQNTCKALPCFTSQNWSRYLPGRPRLLIESTRDEKDISILSTEQTFLLPHQNFGLACFTTTKWPTTSSLGCPRITNASTIFRLATALAQTTLCEELLSTKLFLSGGLFRFRPNFLQTSSVRVGNSKTLSIVFVNISQSLMALILVTASWSS